jgi:hypothetical protein
LKISEANPPRGRSPRTARKEEKMTNEQQAAAEETPVGIDVVNYELHVIRAQQGMDAAMVAARDMATSAMIIFAQVRGFPAAVDLLRLIEQLLPDRSEDRH